MAIDLNDQTTNANTLTNNGATEVNTSLPFVQSTIAVDLVAGSSQFLTAGDTASLSLTGNFTIELWVKFTSTPSSGALMPLITKWEDALNKDYGIWLFNNSGTLQLQAEISQNGNGTFDGARWNWTPSTGVWYHVAVTVTPGNASASTFEFFLDGASQGNGTMFISENAPSIHDGNSSFNIGKDNVGGTYLDGKVDDVRVWNTIRTGTEITNNKGIELSGQESGLVAYWAFESTVTSPSLSPSASQSPSSSASKSASASASASASKSLSPSASQSPSSSASKSLSPSASQSPSASGSASASASASSSNSPSISPSVSASASVSASPSIGYSLYTRGTSESLPSDNSDLTTIYTDAEEVKVSTRNDIRVGQLGALTYLLHQFKVFVATQTYANIELEAQSTLAPKFSPVYLQIYNQITHAWVTLDSESEADDGIDFELLAVLSSLSSYKDAQNVISCRVYQLAI